MNLFLFTQFFYLLCNNFILIRELMSTLIPNFPITDPTWVFFIVLCIILFAPIIFNRLRIPHLIGMIIAGTLIGPYGFNVLLYDSSFELFGRVGIFYIMFLAGLEMDMVGLRQNSTKGTVFGLLTFAAPFVIGYLLGVYVLHYSCMASLLLACIFASHTLVTYPIVSRYGLSRHPAVTISIGATVVALFLSLLILAAISGTYNSDMEGWLFWLVFTLKCVAYIAFVFLVFPKVIRWFFCNYGDSVSQFTFSLALVFFSGAMAALAGLEGIMGAFLAGIILNRYIPHVSPLMNRLEFVGNALFIPYFLIGVGMIINVRLLADTDTLLVVAIMLLVATVSKAIPAWGIMRIFKMSRAEGVMMFGLTDAHAAGALAMVMVGTKLEIAPGEYLMNHSVLNGVVMIILFSCIISSIATERGAAKLAHEVQESPVKHEGDDEKILVPLYNPYTMQDLVSVAMLMRNAKLGRGLIGLNVVIDDEHADARKQFGEQMLDKAVKIAAASDVRMQTQNRLGTNVASAILHAMKELDASEIVMGMHHQKNNVLDSFYGTITQSLLTGMSRQLTIAKLIIPSNTLRRIIVAVPPKAEFEKGFHRWMSRIARMGAQLGCRVNFHATKETLPFIEGYIKKNHKDVRAEFILLDSWDNLILLTGEVNYDHLLVIVSSRRGSISYRQSFEELPTLINKYFANNSLLLLFPDQTGEDEDLISFIEPVKSDKAATWSPTGWISRAMKMHLNND